MSSPSHRESHPARSGLSDFEVRILTEIASEAVTDTEVALKLLIYKDALRRHLRSAMRKVGVRDHAQAVAWAKQHLIGKPDVPAHPAK
jgi:DNA-binding CsgD family transcriptional regulator